MSSELDAKARVRVSPSVYARAFGEELVLLHFGRGEYFGLDEVGASIWRAIEADGAAAVDAIADVLVERYDVERPAALADVLRLVTEMRDASLLDVA